MILVTLMAIVLKKPIFIMEIWVQRRAPWVILAVLILSVVLLWIINPTILRNQFIRMVMAFMTSTLLDRHWEHFLRKLGSELILGLLRLSILNRVCTVCWGYVASTCAARNLLAILEWCYGCQIELGLLGLEIFVIRLVLFAFDSGRVKTIVQVRVLFIHPLGALHGPSLDFDLLKRPNVCFYLTNRFHEITAEPYPNRRLIVFCVFTLLTM